MWQELEVDMYSGRPNPRMAIDAAVSDELDRRVHKLPRRVSGDEPPQGLGYRGLRIIAARSHAAIEIAGGVVAMTDASGSRATYTDTGRAVEGWLLGIAAGRLPAPEAEAVRDVLTQIGRARDR